MSDYQKIIEQATKFAQQLVERELCPLKDRMIPNYHPKNNPGAGVYAIYRNDKLLYIGKTDNVSQRLQQHYSNRKGAPLAKHIKKDTDEKPKHMKEAMNLVKKMQVKFVEVPAGEVQYLTEAIAFIMHRPKYGDLSNH